MHSPTVDVQHKLPPLKSLTSVRFFAAMYVVLFHDQLQDHVKALPVAARFFSSGYTSVMLFFVLSGFILAYNYPSVRNSRSFWIARFSPIYPVYLLATLLMFLFQIRQPGAARDPSLYGGTALVLGLVQAWWPRFASYLNSPAWTLSVEAFFYAMFPLLIAYVPRWRRRTFAATQAVYLLVVSIPLLMHASAAWAPAGDRLALLMEGTIPLFRLDSFIVGIYMGARWGRVVRRRLASGLIHPGEKSRNQAYLGIGTVGSLLLLCTAPSTAARPLRTLLLTFTYTLLLAGLAEVNWPVLTNHWMQIAGEISYGIYILQMPIAHLAFLIRLRFFPWLRDPFLIQLAMLLPCCYVVFRWIEIPARLHIRAALTGRPVPTRVV